MRSGLYDRAHGNDASLQLMHTDVTNLRRANSLPHAFIYALFLLSVMSIYVLVRRQTNYTPSAR